MKRISHDLPGVTQRIARQSEEFEHCVQETLELWRDAKARSFVQQHTADIRPAINQLVSAMSQSTELFEEIAKRVRDPDNY